MFKEKSGRFKASNVLVKQTQTEKPSPKAPDHHLHFTTPAFSLTLKAPCAKPSKHKKRENQTKPFFFLSSQSSLLGFWLSKLSSVSNGER